MRDDSLGPKARSTDPADYQRVPRPVAAMAKDFPDGTAPFLPVGAALYEIRGYAVSCRIAAEDHGKLVVYVAEREVNGRSTPVCGNDHSPPP